MAGVRQRVEVAAAVLIDAGGRFLLAQRPQGKVYAGYWEFPGGKLEPGESAADAIRRELLEELGISAGEVCPWLTRDFEYEHADVRLRFFRIYDWRGEPRGREGQAFGWHETRQALSVAPMLPANGPILRALELPDCYGITQAAAMGVPRFMRSLGDSLARGLRLVQIREKDMPREALLPFARDVVALARRHQARVLVNGDVALAREACADGVHLTALQLRELNARPDCAWVAASCHAREEIALAVRLGVDFVVLGPVKPTPTHPGAPVLEWRGFSLAVRDAATPVYALGGMAHQDLHVARLNGAHGVAMIRGAWT
jgi:8-oxo-dGTP diphosphatase